MPTVLVVDDEADIRELLRASLERAGYHVTEAADGETAISQVLSGAAVDVMILDLGLPDVTGTDVLGRVRPSSALPIIVVSAREGEADKVAALDAGADDYVTKPFGMEELLARVRANIRRSVPKQDTPLRFGDVEIDLRKQLVSRAGDPIHLTPTQYGLLEALATNPGKLLTHRWLLQRVWGPEYGTESQYLRVYVAQLRDKLGDDASSPKLIGTESGAGYRWLRDPEPAA